MYFLKSARYAWLSLLMILPSGPGCESINLPPKRLLASSGEAALLASLGAPIVADAATTPPGPVSLPVAEQESQANPIDLEAALRLGGVDNPTIRLADERVREALAGQLAARSMLLPNVNVGGNYYAHQGPVQDDPGFLIFPTKQSFYLGAGAGAVGTAKLPVPGIWLFTRLGDAIYAPLAAQQRVVAQQSDAHAIRNATLRSVATTYLELAGAEGLREVLRRSQADIIEIARVTGAFARAGQGNASDANRALANAELVRQQLWEAEGGVTAASARLCRLLSLDPAMRLRTPGGPIVPLRLIAEDTDLESLIADAIRSRPELRTCRAAIQEAQIQVSQARIRPWLPLVGIGYSAGVFGGGSNLVATSFGPLQERSDISVLAVWNMQNLGVGNRAQVSTANAILGQALANYDLVVNQIRTEVTDAVAACRTAAREMEAAQAALIAAEEGFRLEADRIKQGQGLPIETIDSFRQLLDSRQDLVRAIIRFDVAQWQLFVALGSTPTSDS